MKNHWARNLPEVGRPFLKQAEEIEAKLKRRSDLLDEIRTIEQEVNIANLALRAQASAHWSKSEIEEAMATSVHQACSGGH